MTDHSRAALRSRAVMALLGNSLKLAFPQLASTIDLRLQGVDASSIGPLALKFTAAQIMHDLLDVVGAGGNPVLPVQQHLIDTANISNRIVSFVLDGKVHIATGILVGPSSVLTPAHIFFQDDGRLIDRSRPGRLTVEAHTTLFGKSIMEGDLSSTTLEDPNGVEWVIDPGLDGDYADREVDFLDFAIVRLKRALGDDYAGDQPRGWINIPTVESADVLASDTAIRVFQYLDREALLFSAGVVRDVIENGWRVRHTASTAQSASGALIVNSQSRFVAMHLSGSATDERPKFNRGLPVRRIAEQIDDPRTGVTVRSLLR